MIDIPSLLTTTYLHVVSIPPHSQTRETHIRTKTPACETLFTNKISANISVNVKQALRHLSD